MESDFIISEPGFQTSIMTTPFLFTFQPQILDYEQRQRKCRNIKEVQGTILEELGFMEYGQSLCFHACQKRFEFQHRNITTWDLPIYGQLIGSNSSSDCGCDLPSCGEVVYSYQIDTVALYADRLCRQKEYFEAIAWDKDAVEMFRQKESLQKGYFLGEL